LSNRRKTIIGSKMMLTRSHAPLFGTVSLKMPNRLTTAHRKACTRVRDTIRLAERSAYQREQDFDAIPHSPVNETIVRGVFHHQVDGEAVQDAQGGYNDGGPDEDGDNSR
jgi:hypothetical protein